jgi:hypothetical protein
MSSLTLWRDRLFSLLGLLKGNKSSTHPHVYSETAYRDLILSETKRSARSGHLCRILLVYCANAQGRVMPLGSELAGKTISVLSTGCRDTDYIGWYRQYLILGVLLTALRPDSSGDDGCDYLKTRVMDRLHSVLIPMVDHSLQIRVLDDSDLTTFNASDHPTLSCGSKE